MTETNTNTKQNEQNCSKCNGDKTTKAGTRAYASGLYIMRRCVACGHHFKGEQLKENLGGI
jgi:hypothetical protein